MRLIVTAAVCLALFGCGDTATPGDDIQNEPESDSSVEGGGDAARDLPAPGDAEGASEVDTVGGDVSDGDATDVITAPTMVVATPDDPGAPTETSKRMAAAIPGAELHWLEPARHLATLEHPERFNALARGFLARVG